MGLIKDLYLIVSGREQPVQPIDLNVLRIKLRGHDHYKLHMICEDLNDRLQPEVPITPTMIGRRVIEKFLYQSYNESTERMVRNLLPDFIDQPAESTDMRTDIRRQV